MPKPNKTLKKSSQYLLSRKIFHKITWRFEIQYKHCNPYNAKHLNYKGNQERYLDYFKKVNEMIDKTNCWYNIFAKIRRYRGSPPRLFKIENFNITERTLKVDTFNLMMKEKLGKSWNYEKYRKLPIEKFKFHKETLSGSTEKSILSHFTN